ncbi:hypothetical protein ACH4YO_00300 [Streptomyces noursei]|nr:hypothetical protein SNOUR_10145 [Streptomyces noursei ATCC 11455]MCZ0992649.1 hypothetical protein [Streptomyces noursei]
MSGTTEFVARVHGGAPSALEDDRMVAQVRLPAKVGAATGLQSG